MQSKSVLPYLIAFSALALAAPAQATTCTFTGAPGPYMSCLADEITQLMDDVINLDTRLADLEASAVRQAGALPIELRRGEFGFFDPIITYTAPDGTVDTVDITGIVDGEIRVGAAGVLAVQWGTSTTDSKVFLDVGGVGSACTLIHTDSDAARPGLYYATDTGNNVDHIWGVGGVNTLIFAKEGESESPMDQWLDLGVICFDGGL